MKKPEHKRTFNTEDIFRYLEGRMDNLERHQFEKAALEDPFLSEAIEGFEKKDPALVKEDLQLLQHSIEEKFRKRPRVVPLFPGKYWAAASILLLLLAGMASYFIWIDSPEIPAIAKNEKAIRQKADSSIPADTNLSKMEEVVQEQTVKAETKAEEKKVRKDDSPNQLLISQDEPNKKPVASETEPIRKEVEVRNIPRPDSLENISPAAAPAAKSPEKPSRNENPQIQNNRAAHAPAVYYFKGNVINSQQEPIAFANLSIDHGRSFRYTDARGNFTLVAADSVLPVEIRARGYQNYSTVMSASMGPMQFSMTEKVSKEQKDSMAYPMAGVKEEDEESLDENHPFAEPADGWAAYQNYLVNNLREPGQSGKIPIHGTVDLSFQVDSLHRFSNFMIEKSLCPACDQEAIRLVREGPKWEIYNSKEPIRTRLTIVF